MSFEQASNRGTDTNMLVGGKLAISDCSQVTDGAAIVVLASEKFIHERGYENKPIIKGYGHRTAPMLFDKKIDESIESEYILPWTRQACLDAYRRSGLTVDDIDAETYTGSAITQPTLAVKDIALDKTLVLNTDYTVSYSNNKKNK